MWAYAYPSHSFSLQIRNLYIQLDLQATYWWHKVIMPTYSGKSHQERPQDLVRGVNSPLAAWGEIFFWKFDYEMVHSEVYVNKYVISIAPLSPPPIRNSPIQKTALFACFRFLIFHPFLQGGQLTHLPYVRTPINPIFQARSRNPSRIPGLQVPPYSVAEYCDVYLSVSVFVCLSVHQHDCGTMHPIIIEVSKLFCACYRWPSLVPSLATLRMR